MGNKSSKKSIPLKEEKEKENNKNTKMNNEVIQITQETQKSTSKPGSLENTLNDKEEEKNIPSSFPKKIENDEISQLEAISKELKEKNKIKVFNENKSNNKDNNNIKDDNKKNIIKNNLHNEYVVDINKIHRKKNGKIMKVPKKLKNFISTSKYTWYNFIPKILYEQFSKMSNIYFVIIAILQCFPDISNADGKPIILFPLCIVVFINSVKDFYEDWKRKKSDDEENNRTVEVFDSIKKKFVSKKWKNIYVGNIVKIKKDEYFPADCVLISSSDRKTHNCFIESKNLDGETSLKIKKSINNFVERCRDLSTFQGKLTTQLPNEYIYQFDAFFEFDPIINNKAENTNGNNITNETTVNDTTNHMTASVIRISDKVDGLKKSELILEDYYTKDENIKNVTDDDYLGGDEDGGYSEEESDKNYSVHTYYTNRKKRFSDFEEKNKKNESIILDINNFLLRGCSLRQTDSVLCFVVYTGKNTKIMQNSPGARSKTSSLEKRMNQQIKYIFSFLILLSLVASVFSLIQIIVTRGDPTPYLYQDGNDRPFNFEEYAKMYYVIFSTDNLKKIFNQKDSIFMMIKKFIKEISPIFDLNVIFFFMIKLGTWCVLMNNLVPISLLMTLELVKYFQGWFISWDADIYDKKKKVMTKVQTSTLNEELGQVRYIFSDKTGTLTKNYMNFKRVTIGYKQYNQSKEEDVDISAIFDTKLLKDKNKNTKKEKEKEEQNDNKSDINGQFANIENNGENTNSNNKPVVYRDEYGKITNILFLNDEELIKDLKLNIQGNNKNNDTNIDNDEIKLDASNVNNKIIVDSSDGEEEDDNLSLNNNLNYNINENNTKKDIKEKLSQDNFLNLFMTAISTCHSGIINEKKYESSKKIVYQASSPDEIALLNFARKYKYIFFGREKSNKIIIEKPDIINNNKTLRKVTYKIPIQFEYSSERKSMSVIVQNDDNQEEIYLFMKGADDVILSKIDKKNKNNQKIIKNIENALDEYAKEGLRILAVAYKKISLNELNLYQKEYLNACKSTYCKKELLEILSKKNRK